MSESIPAEPESSRGDKRRACKVGLHVLTIPRWRPPLTNAWRGRHWSKAHRLRRQAEELLAAYAREQGIPRAAGRRRVAVEVVLGPRMRRADPDALDKLLLDALVNAGLLLDDGERGLAGRVAVHFRWADRGGWWGTVLTFEDVVDA
jgi:hypothetical protein